MTTSDLRLAYPKGCRVRLKPLGRMAVRHEQEGRVGTVRGYGRGDGALRIAWDGYKSLQVWHRDYVERV